MNRSLHVLSVGLSLRLRARLKGEIPGLELVHVSRESAVSDALRWGHFSAILVDQRALTSPPRDFFRKYGGRAPQVSVFVARQRMPPTVLRELLQTSNLVGIFHAPANADDFLGLLTLELGLARSTQRPSTPSDTTDLGGLWKQHHGSLKQRIHRLGKLVDSASQPRPAALSSAYRDARLVANSLGSFGYHKATLLARTLSHHIANAMAGQPLHSGCHSLVKALHEYLNQLRPGYQHESPWLISVSQDPEWALQVQAEAELLGWKHRNCKHFAELTEVAEVKRARALLIDLRQSWLDGTESQWGELAQETIPAFFVGSTERLRFCKPHQRISSASSPYETLLQVHRAQVCPPENLLISVLVYDPNPVTGNLSQEVLSQLDFQVELVTQELDFWAYLEKSRPDLFMIPLQCGKLNGYEITRALRLDPRFSSAPILMTSEFSDRLTSVRAHEAGVDDLLLVPFSPRELRAVVSNRIRLFQERLFAESLHLKHSSAYPMLGGLLLQARREQALLELSLVTAQDCNPEGLFELATRLHLSLRSTDVVRIWSDHQILIGTLLRGPHSPKTRLSQALQNLQPDAQVTSAVFPRDGESLEELLEKMEFMPGQGTS